jgi:uncharacterized protein YjbJ (UPF0337 family)
MDSDKWEIERASAIVVSLQVSASSAVWRASCACVGSCRADQRDEAARRSDAPRGDSKDEERISMQDDFDTNRDRDLEPDSDIGKTGTSHQAKGNMHKAAGKIEEGWGKLTGQHDVETKGKAKQVQGSAENVVGRVQSNASDKLDDLGERRDDLLDDH